MKRYNNTKVIYIWDTEQDKKQAIRMHNQEKQDIKDLVSFEISLAEKEFKKKIEEWNIMLDTPEFDDNDAGLVRDEMKELIQKLKDDTQEIKDEKRNRSFFTKRNNLFRELVK